MKQKLCIASSLMVLTMGPGRLMGQTTAAVQFTQGATTINLQSQRGVPISTNVNPSIGSDGQQPSIDSSTGLPNTPTIKQFASLITFGAVTAARTNTTGLTNNAYLQGTNAFSLAVATAMQLPVGVSGNTVFVLRRASVGAPYVAQSINFYFGSVITPPASDYRGNRLSNSSPSLYWLAKPYPAGSYTNSSSTNALFYYSPNAQQAFATHSGPISVTWITAARFTGTNVPAYTNQLATAGIPSYFTNIDNSVSLLYTANYLVSVSPVKQPQNIYWTEGAFQNSGYPVTVPAGRISALNVIYNASVPATVTSPYPENGSTNGLPYTTLWYDNVGAIHAYNAAGRVFAEIDGTANGDGTSQFLGFEIVDVAQTPPQVELTNYLGDVLTPYADPTQGGNLAPAQSKNNSLGTQYYFQNGSIFYADKATTAQNELLLYWLDSGVAGLQWPYVYDDYTLVWPSDPSQYSFYLRPPAVDKPHAQLTAVQLDPAEAPTIDYQDPLDQLRAFLTPTDGFYTWLTSAYPAQRALLRFNAQGNVRFERVFSILAQGLQDNALLNQSVVTNLAAWDATNSTLTNYAGGYSPPYVTNQTVNVGDQIPDPSGELGSTNGAYGDYWAGYINTNATTAFVPNIGSSFDPAAYIDPFVNGFTAANLGAIIPVNAIPGHNALEVWWFRQNNANPENGFNYVYWPAVIGDYTIQWPANAPSIVLANNQGSGTTNPLISAGSIYYQNDPTQPGYNPNEEHAVMLGGQAYALRDDLNVTSTTNTSLPFNGYSSAPFVLVSYTGPDGRPAMSVFQVMRENPAAGQYFDYVVAAGTQLQAPMPLPLLPLPLAPNTNSPTGYTNYDTEPPATSGDLPTGWLSSDATGQYSLYPSFTFQDRKNNFWVYRGLNAGLPPLAAGAYNTNSQSFGALPPAVVLANTNFTYYVHVSRLLDSLTVGLPNLPLGLTGLTIEENDTNGLSITGVPTIPGSNTITIVLTDSADGSQVTNFLSVIVTNSGPVSALGPLVITSTNQYSGEMDTYSNRPPALAQAPGISNSFTMRYYYPTLPGFAWPSLGNASNWPAVGSIVPYLRPLTNGVFAGDGASSNTPSLDIVYRPVWPGFQNGVPLPTLAQGETLTTAINGLTAVRRQDSVQVLYQQSIARNIRSNTASVVLYDPTVQKQSSLAALVATNNGFPASILTDAYAGGLYFPNLPPNLISRIWYDPNSQNLYFKGQFVSDPVNGDYVMLNVLRGDDLAAVNGLCARSDPAYMAWTNAVAQLSAVEYTFSQNQYGNYTINTNLTVTNYAGDLVKVTSSDTAVDSYALCGAGPGQGYITYIVANGLNPAYAADPVSVSIARVAPPLYAGAIVIANSANASPFGQVITFEHTSDVAGETTNYLYDWRIEPPVNGQPPPFGTEADWTPLPQTNPGPVLQFGASGILGLTDNYISMRYAYLSTSNGVVSTNWSPWAGPILAEGWISRVTQAIDPIAGQTQNLYDNPANTTASLIELAGARWNGNVPLNASSLTNNGLIQLYETVLNLGENLSINSGINYGPANQALLLAAGYLNDLYVTLGNDAWASSLNPTIGFGTDNATYGSVATASFVFEGEEPTLLDQNLALLRGRDDSVAPGVDLPPVYNRLYWNFTYGLAAGQVIYTLNYNITDQNGDGVVNAADAQIMFPQGHGDAYGHYLTALTEYYKLLMNPNFDWVPQAQTVLILGADVTVNYQNESKFAATAAALARTGRQVFDLTWREDYQPGTAAGWDYLSTNYIGQYPYVNNAGQTEQITRYWGLDHWASRVGQGTYMNWVVGNSILPYQDPNPRDQGIQIVDRQTVQDLQELPQTAAALEADMDNANAGFTPLGMAQNAIPFDINPQQVTGADPQTHFEQIYSRAVQALNNASVAFDAAQNVTQELRQQQDSLSDLQAAVAAQELAYNDQLIELYGTPYPEDIGPGGTYQDGYTGPDLAHYMYVDNVDTNTYNGLLPNPATNNTYYVDVQKLPTSWFDSVFTNWPLVSSFTPNYTNSTNVIAMNIGPNGFFGKPASWTEERGSIGSIQTAIAAVTAAQDQYRQAAFNAMTDKKNLDYAAFLFAAQNATNVQDLNLQQLIQSTQTKLNNTQTGFNIADNALSLANAGLGDIVTFLGIDALQDAVALPLTWLQLASLLAQIALGSTEQGIVNSDQNTILQYQQEINTNQYNLGVITALQNLTQLENSLRVDLTAINQAMVALNGAQANYQALVAQGNRIQQERETFRQHTAAQVQGYTVADSAFLVFQNENLERYNTLFNLAAQYAYMAANAYDYETGLLDTQAGRSYLNQIISSCALGVIQDGVPQLSGTDTGDPGLANALAEMNADFQALQGRLGFNNPDGYGTVASLRSENYRILPGAAGDTAWQQTLQQSMVPDLRADSDVRNHCLQIDDGSGQAVPGIELIFSTTITDGQNLFGLPLGPGDHAFSSSSFATKIFALGVSLDGYQGMDDPVTGAATNLGPNSLAATPYVYLIPVGADAMRSPPLGDTSTIRTWNVDDVAIPLPFNIGASDFSSQPFYTASDSLTEPLFAIRKQEAFRPVPTTDSFTPTIYGGALQLNSFTNQRLIGRSVWNTKWKLIIPGRTLLSNPYQGLNTFINTVKDVHLYFITYSYAGN